MRTDDRVKKINDMIKSNGSQIFAGETPDMKLLEREITEFIHSLAHMNAENAREYANLVNIWAGEVKKMSDKLNQTKSQIQAEMSQAQLQGRAATAYTIANKYSNKP